MKLRLPGRRVGATVAAASAAMLGLAVAAPTASADSSPIPVPSVFTGASRGLTAEVAIQGAIWDAETSAQAYQLFTCTPVGEPRVFETFNDPYFGHLFRAEADVFCTP